MSDELVERAKNAERLLRYEIDTDYLAGLIQSLREALQSNEDLEAKAFRAAFVPARDLYERDTRISELTAQLAEARESERAAVERSVKLWALLDDIDTLDDACRGDDDLFRTLTRAAQQKRHAIMSGEEWDAARQTGEPA